MPNFFVRRGRKKLKRLLHKYIEFYIEYVEYCVKRNVKERPLWEDVIQYVVVELIKLYPKRDSYTDFDWVVRSAIRNKVNTARTNIGRDNKLFVFENKLNINDKDGELAGASAERAFYLTSKAYSIYETNVRGSKIVDYINDMRHRISVGKFADQFNDFDRSYLETLMWLYGIGYKRYDRDDLIECMGWDLEDRNAFSAKLSQFRSKMRKYISEGFEI